MKKPTYVSIPFEEWEEYQELKKEEEPKFAENLEDVDRPWYLDTYGEPEEVSEKAYQDKNHLPTEELTEGLLALIQLLSFRHDVWEKEGKPDVSSVYWSIGYDRYFEKLDVFKFGGGFFRFKKEETAEYFLKKHKELLTEYFNKIIK